MNIEIDDSGKINFVTKQQHWQGERPGVMQVARFAGQEMMAVTDDSGAYDLHYMGFMTRGFKTIEDAKKAAPEFARKVLGRMSEMVAD